MPNVIAGSPEELRGDAPLQIQWDELVERQGLGLGFQFEWCRVLWDLHRNQHELQLLQAWDDRRLVGLAPLVTKYVRQKGVTLRWMQSLFALHEIHGTPFIAGEGNHGSIEALLDHVLGDGKSWDLWTMHFVKDDGQAAIFETQLRRHGVPFVAADTKKSPYMPIKASWEEQSKSLQARFRTTVRSRERRLREKGKLTLEYLDTPSRLEAGLKAIQVIEADSWKLGAGTALTQDPKQWPFYVRYGELAAAKGSLRLPVLFLDGEPIAYDYSIMHKGVYYLLKTSYRNSYRQDYPGTVLRKMVVENLSAEQTKEFDFLGLDEEWKMKWTDTVRAHVAYTVFNRTLSGRYVHLVGALAQRVRSWMPQGNGLLPPRNPRSRSMYSVPSSDQESLGVPLPTRCYRFSAWPCSRGSR
jgi:CelD/BcsL family acetyltransferase involved in cellulose biosynthesis